MTPRAQAATLAAAVFMAGAVGAQVQHSLSSAAPVPRVARATFGAENATATILVGEQSGRVHCRKVGAPVVAGKEAPALAQLCAALLAVPATVTSAAGDAVVGK